MDKILITPRSLTKDPHPDLDLLSQAGFRLVFSSPGKQPDEEELMQLLPGCVGYLAGVEPITSRVLESARVLKAISRNGTGIDNIDLETCKRLNIKVLRAEGANAQGVAELTIALLLAMARSISFSDAKMKMGKWKRVRGFEVKNKTLGLVGCGKIGQKVAQMALRLDMLVQACDLCPDESFCDSSGFCFGTLDQVLKSSDVISLHCPPLSTGEPLITKENIAKMKRRVQIINTARAELVDTGAVLEALESGRIAGFATDVYDMEPPGITALIKHERVIATPHIGGYTDESISRATRAAVENLLEFFGKSHPP